MKRLLKITAWILGAVVLLLVIAVIALPRIIDPNDYRDDIGALVKRETGRDLLIRGDLKLSVFPWLGVDVGDTQLANAPGFGPHPFAQFNRAKVRVKLLPLVLHRAVELDTVELDGLRLALARDRSGRTNWDDLMQPRETPPTQPPEPGQREFSSLRLGGVVIRDAQITWSDKQQGREAQLGNLNLSTGALDLRAPIALRLDTDFALSAPQAAGHVNFSGTLHHDADRYRAEGMTLALQANGQAIPGGRVQLTVSGDAAVDLKAQTAEGNNLRLAAYGAELVANLKAQRILAQPDAQGGVELRVTDANTLASALAGRLPRNVALEPKALDGARLTTRFDLSLGQGTANLPEFRATLLGAEVIAAAQASRLNAKPAVQGTLRVEIKDGQLFTSPVRASLPKGFTPGALTGARLESAFNADLASERLSLANTRLDAAEIHLTAAVQGKGILSNPAFTGNAALAPLVPREVLEKFGITLPATADPTALGKASLTTQFDAGRNHLALQNLVARVDQSTLTGRAAVARFTPLQLRYDLRLDQIDVDRYLAPPSKEKPAAATGAATAPLQLPLKELRALDIDGTLRVGRLKAANMQSTEALATLRAKAGQFRIHPVGAKLYGGSYAGDLGLDVRGDTPLLSMNENLSGIQVGPLLQDFMGKDYVTGTAQLSAKLTARGTDFLQIRRTLGGEAAFAFENGAVKGVDILQLIARDYAKVLGQAAQIKEGDRTEFGEMRGTATVNEGLVTNRDLSVKTPIAQMTGQGTAHLATEKVDYRLNTTITATKGTLAQIKGQTIPVQIGGNFSKLTYSVDVGAALKSKAQSEVQRRLDEEKKKQEQRLQEQLQKGLKGLFK